VSAIVWAWTCDIVYQSSVMQLTPIVVINWIQGKYMLENKKLSDLDNVLVPT